jgi:hypothetical protein
MDKVVGAKRVDEFREQGMYIAQSQGKGGLVQRGQIVPNRHSFNLLISPAGLSKERLQKKLNCVADQKVDWQLHLHFLSGIVL